LIVERLTVQAVEVIDAKVAVIEKHDMGRVLPGNPLADGTVAGVIVDRIVVRVGVDVIAPPRVLMRHALLLFLAYLDRFVLVAETVCHGRRRR
jgi:hypothetical protein